jgi:hypothetical protein
VIVDACRRPAENDERVSGPADGRFPIRLPSPVAVGPVPRRLSSRTARSRGRAESQRGASWGREGDPGGRLHRDARARQRPRSPRSRVMSSPAIRAPSLRLLTGATPVRQHRFRPSQGRHRCCRPCESRVRRELVLYAGGPLASVIFVVCAWPEVSVQPIVTVSLGWCVSMRVLSCVSD